MFPHGAIKHLRWAAGTLYFSRTFLSGSALDGPVLGVGQRPTFFYTRTARQDGIVRQDISLLGGMNVIGIPRSMEQLAEIEHLIAPSVEAAGYDIVRVQFMGGDRHTLQIMAERKDRRPVTVDDCADISRLISAVLDVEDAVPESYVLEVSSPGIDRPLVRIEDYARFAGFEARVETSRPVDGRRRFRGRLKGVTAGNILMTQDDEDAEIPFAEIRRGTLVLTDDLIAASLNEPNG